MLAIGITYLVIGSLFAILLLSHSETNKDFGDALLCLAAVIVWPIYILIVASIGLSDHYKKKSYALTSMKRGQAFHLLETLCSLKLISRKTYLNISAGDINRMIKSRHNKKMFNNLKENR